MRLLALLLVRLATAGEPATADEVIAASREARRVDTAVERLRMVLVGRSGAERERELEMRVRRDGEVVKTWIRFTGPADVAGTQLVLVDHPDRPDEQLLYLPALGRVSRIAGRARTGSFAGSDFSYEDLEFAGAGGENTLVSADAEGWVIDTTPAEGSAYGRLRSWIRRDDLLPHKVEYYDRKGALLKVLTVEETAREAGHVIPVRSVMENVRRGTRTRLEVLDHALDVPAEQVPDETFTAAWMERH